MSHDPLDGVSSSSQRQHSRAEATAEDSYSLLDQPPWWGRVLGALCGLVVLPLSATIFAVMIVLLGGSFWFLILLPLAAVAVGPVLGFLFPKPAVYVFDHSSLFGKPLSAWVLEWIVR